MSRLVVQLSVRGAVLLKDGREREPRVTIYTDDGVRSTMERRVVTQEWQAISLIAVHSADWLAAVLNGQLSLDAVTTLGTDVGLSADKNAGSARLSLAAVLAEPGRVHRRELTVNLLDTAERRRTAAKGWIEVRANTALLVNGRSYPLNISVEQAEQDYERRQEIRRARFAEFGQLVRGWQRLFDAIPQTFPAASSINCYLMRSGDGMMLPSISYLLQPRPDGVDVNYYENALRIIMRREKLSERSLLELSVTDRRVASVGVQMLALWCNYVPYVSDQAYVPLREPEQESQSVWARVIGAQSGHHLHMKHFAMEEFESAEIYDADDCEGVGMVIVRHHGYVLAIPANRRSAVLNHVCAALRLYAPLLLLCGVTSADLGGDFAALTAPGAKMGAHMFALLVPVGRLMRMISRVESLHSTPLNLRPSTEFELNCERTRDLPILCGEGTGLLAPLPLNLAEHKRLLLPPPIAQTTPRAEAWVVLAGARQVPGLRAAMVPDARGMSLFGSALGTRNPVFSNNSLFVTDLLQAVFPDAFSGGVRKWYHLAGRPGITSHFYRTAQLALLPTLAEQGSAVRSLVFVQRARDSPAGWSVGCTFGDLLSEGTADAVHEVGALPEQAPDAAQLRDMIEEMRTEPRPPALAPPPERLGENNTWDRTARVPSAALHAEMEKQRRLAMRLGLIAEIQAIRHITRYARNASFVGLPHLLSDCDCERRLAVELLASGDEELLAALQGESLEDLLRAFVAAMPSEPERRLPIVGEFMFNYEQWQQRSKAVILHAGESIALGNAVVLRTGSHADFEHVTATTGGLLLQQHVMIQYQ